MEHSCLDNARTMIDTREELLGALEEAAELEHGLMVQYLFAAMTLKRGTQDGLNEEQAAAVARWRQTVYLVARQEMGHLGTVQNLLSIIGAPAHFGLPPFPSPSRYYRPSQVFSLEPMSEQTIARFVHFEAPLPIRTLDTFALEPDPLEYRSVGDLYGQISVALGTIPERELFLGPAAAQDAAAWSFDVTVHPTRSLAEARQAIEQIVEEGEATTSGGPASHYQRFLGIQQELADLSQRDPRFEPSRRVISNPRTSGGEPSERLTAAPARAVAELFNAAYKTLLLTLGQVYKFQDHPDVPIADVDTVAELRMAATGLMQGVIRPLGQEVIPELKAHDSDDGRYAAPPFEIYAGPLAVHWDRKVAWTTIAERLLTERDAARALIDIGLGMNAIADSLEASYVRMSDLIG